MADYAGQCRDDEDDVAEEANDDTDKDGLEACKSVKLVFLVDQNVGSRNLRPHFVSAMMPPAIGMTYDKKVKVEVTALAATLPRPRAPDVWFAPAAPFATAPRPSPPLGRAPRTKLENALRVPWYDARSASSTTHIAIATQGMDAGTLHVSTLVDLDVRQTRRTCEAACTLRL